MKNTQKIHEIARKRTKIKKFIRGFNPRPPLCKVCQKLARLQFTVPRVCMTRRWGKNHWILRFLKKLLFFFLQYWLLVRAHVPGRNARARVHVHALRVR